MKLVYLTYKGAVRDHARTMASADPSVTLHLIRPNQSSEAEPIRNDHQHERCRNHPGYDIRGKYFFIDITTGGSYYSPATP